MCGRVVFRSDVLALSVLIGRLDGEYCVSKTLLGTLVDLFEVKLEREIGDGVPDRLACAIAVIRVVRVLKLNGVGVATLLSIVSSVTNHGIVVEHRLVEDDYLSVGVYL